MSILDFDNEQAHYILTPDYKKELMIKLNNSGNIAHELYKTANDWTDYSFNQERSQKMVENNWKIEKTFQMGRKWKLANIGRTSISYCTKSDDNFISLSLFTAFDIKFVDLFYQLTIYEDGVFVQHRPHFAHSDIEELKKLLDAHLKHVFKTYKEFSIA